MIEMHPKDPIMLHLQKTMGNLVPNFSDQMGNKEESEGEACGRCGYSRSVFYSTL